MTDDEDIRDAMLFRFWCKMATYPGGKPSRMAKALENCHTVEDYRAALTLVAKEEGLNLP